METKNYIGMRFVSAMVRKLRDGEKVSSLRTNFTGSVGDVIFCKESFRPAAYKDGKLYVDYQADWEDPNLPEERKSKTGEPEALQVIDEISPEMMDQMIEKLYAARDKERKPGWISSMVMPRAIARIYCEVARVSKIRLHDVDGLLARRDGFASEVEFHDFWKMVYGEREWMKNPMVDVVAFSSVQVRW